MGLNRYGSNYSPLQIRRNKLSLKNIYKVKSLLKNPTFKFINPEKETLDANKSSPLRSQSGSKKQHTKFNLENKGVLPDFSYSRKEIKEPTWGLPSIRINLSLADLPIDKPPTLVTRRDLKKWSRINAKDEKTYIQAAPKAK